MDFSFSDLNLQLDGQLPINFNSVESDYLATPPSIETCPTSRLVQRFFAKAKRFALIPSTPRCGLTSSPRHSAALAQELLKFADCGEYITGMNLHGD